MTLRMSIIGTPFPIPNPDPGIFVKILKGVGKVVKYAWNVITGEDEKQEQIAASRAINPTKNTADEIAELNQLLTEFRKNIASAADGMEHEMIVECSMMLQEIMNLFEEHNAKLKIARSESIKRKFSRIGKELKGTFADHVQKRISLDDAECVKILKLPAGELKNQRLQEMKQKVFIEAGNEIIRRIRDAVQDSSDTVEDNFEMHLERTEDRIQEKAEAFSKLSMAADSDTQTVESILLKADYLAAVCSYADSLCEI